MFDDFLMNYKFQLSQSKYFTIITARTVFYLYIFYYIKIISQPIFILFNC